MSRTNRQERNILPKKAKIDPFYTQPFPCTFYVCEQGICGNWALTLHSAKLFPKPDFCYNKVQLTKDYTGNRLTGGYPLSKRYLSRRYGKSDSDNSKRIFQRQAKQFYYPSYFTPIIVYIPIRFYRIYKTIVL